MLTPDALTIGPLVLAWERLALLVFAFAFAALLPGPRAVGVLFAGLLAGRLGYGLLHWGDLQTGPGGVWSLLDPRTGGISLWAALAGGLGWGWWRRAPLVAVVRAGLGAGAAALLPLLLVPAAPAQLSARGYASVAATGPQPPAPLPAGEAVLVNVWASWCPPCRAEMPLLDAHWRAGAPIVMLNAGEDPDAVQRYLKGAGLNMATLLDPGAARAELRISGLPTTVLLAPDGTVLARHLGPLDGAQLAALLRRAGEAEAAD